MESYTAGAKFDCLLFDMDDTLPTELRNQFSLPQEHTSWHYQIADYMLNKLQIEESLVLKMCLDLYQEYGTTMAGLKVLGYDFNYDEFHACVHGTLPYEKSKPDPVLRQLLSLPQRKIIFTNSDKAHAATVLKKLGLEDCFEGVICFETLNPSTIAKFGFSPIATWVLLLRGCPYIVCDMTRRSSHTGTEELLRGEWKGGERCLPEGSAWRGRLGRRRGRNGGRRARSVASDLSLLPRRCVYVLDPDHALEMECFNRGSSSNVAYICWCTRMLFVANAGDCRAVLGKRGQAVELSRDHKPNCKSEKIRIENLGGTVFYGYLNGQLAVARALGDWHMKGPKGSISPLSAEPELQEVVLTEEDEFLIIGCDGLWDVMSSQCAVTIVRKELMSHNHPERCSSELVQEALKRNSCDNLTVVVICFSSNPPPQIEVPRSRVRRSISLEGLHLLRGALDSNA